MEKFRIEVGKLSCRCETDAQNTVWQGNKITAGYALPRTKKLERVTTFSARLMFQDEVLSATCADMTHQRESKPTVMGDGRETIPAGSV